MTNLVDPVVESVTEALSSSEELRFEFPLALLPSLEGEEEPRLEWESGFQTFLAQVGKAEMENRLEEEEEDEELPLPEVEVAAAG